MKEITKRRKKTKENFMGVGDEWLVSQMQDILIHGKKAFDGCAMEMGKMLAETIMYMEREELAGPDYHPVYSHLRKWASQPGSVFIGGSKVRVNHPRLRDAEGETVLRSYQQLKDPTQFSDELLAKVLRGLSGRKYKETILQTAGAFGISSGSISNRVVEATERQLSELLDRDLSGINVFAVFLDTVHRGGSAFIVALGLDQKGKKHNLGFWEGATENNEICLELFNDLELRGLKLGKDILFVTDGGSGIIKALKNRYGSDLIHQRCTIHKDRNIQSHLPKRRRKEAHRRFRIALSMKSYSDAKGELELLEKWLRETNESAADSLVEAMEEILTLHRLQVPELLRKTLHSTNLIEGVFYQVRRMERNIKRYRSSKMSRRWLGACLIQAEKQFRLVQGYQSIPLVIKNIQQQQMKEIKKAA